MSGGQQQRVALARALVNHPKVLLLDEPLGALDLKLRKQMQLELKRIQQEVGITFIYVTHDQEEAMTMSNRLAVMRLGKIEQLGDPETVYENPATEFVAGFLGRPNMLEGELKEGANGVATVSLRDGGAVQLPSSRVPSDAAGHGEGRRASGEAHDLPRRRRGGARRPQPCVRTRHDDHLHRREPPVQGRGRRRHDHDRVRAEPRPARRHPVKARPSRSRGSPSTRSRWRRRKA